MRTRLIFSGLVLMVAATAATVKSNRITFVTETLKPARPAGAFVFMDHSAACATLTNCYTKNLTLAREVVQKFVDVGAEMFLLPSLDLAETEILAQAITEKGKVFFTQERWAFERASATGTFNCATFTRDRIDTHFKPLLERFPDSFRGLHFKDEPVVSEAANLAAMASCVRANATSQSLEIFLNLLGLPTNTFTTEANRTVHTPAHLGFSSNDAGCTLTQPSWLQTHLNNYSAYVSAFAGTVKPTYLAFDYYPFDSAHGGCPRAQEIVMTYNLAVISAAASKYGAEPVMYVQNFASIDNSQYRFVNGAKLRWQLGKATQMGVKRLAYFVSHNFDSYVGLLHGNNQPTGLYTELKNYLHPLAVVQFAALRDLTWVGYNSPALGQNSNPVIRTNSSPYVGIGVYQDPSVSQRYVLAVSSVDSSVGRPLGHYITFNQGWVRKTEYFDPPRNQWVTIPIKNGDTSTNFIWPDLNNYSVMLYRITH